VPGPFAYVIWFIGLLCEAAVLVSAFKKNAFRRYLLLNVYVAGLIVSEIGRYRILAEYGLLSKQYNYFYYYSDAVLTIFLYFALSTLYSHVFSEMNAERYVKLGTILLLAGTAIFSYSVVIQSSAKLVTHFVFELSQNLYFVGLVLTYVLWAAILKLRETRTRLIQIVLSLGVYFSLIAANYAIRNLYPPLSSVSAPIVQVCSTFLPLAWAYAFWRLPEDARLAPARLAVIPR
jgi:membrane-associated HD superfamily phosphohydrolase